MIFNFSFLSSNSTVSALANTNSEFLNSYTINFNEGSSLKDTSQAINQILISTKDEKDSKTNIQLNSELETDKTILPISINLDSTNSELDIQNKFQQAKDTQIKSLKDLKAQTSKAIDFKAKVANQISLADSTASKISFDVNTLNLINNIELDDLNALETINQTLSSLEQIPTVSLEVQTLQDSNADKMILKLSSELDSNLNSTVNKNIKLKSNSKAEFNQTNQVFEDYIKEVELESKLETENAQEARPEFDVLYQSDYTDGELNQLIAKWERKPKVINVPTFNEILTTTSLDAMTELEVSNISQLEAKSAIERLNREKTINGETKLQTDLDQATPTIEKISKDRAKNTSAPIINSTIKLQIANPNFKDVVKEKQANQKILDDQQKQVETQDKIQRLEREFKQNNKQPTTELEKLDYESNRTNYLIDNDSNLTTDQKTSAKRNYKNTLKRNSVANQPTVIESKFSRSQSSSDNSSTSSQTNNSSNSSNASNSSPIALNSNQPSSDNWVASLTNAIFGSSIQAEAKGLNNSDTALSIYSWDYNGGFALDIPNGNTNIGTQIAVNYNNSDNAQKWWFNNSQEIRSKLNTDRCLDISGGNYTNGTTIALHYCTGNDAQKFFFYGNTLRSWANPNFCVDVPSNNWTPNVVRLWDCNASGAQKFVPGDNGFNINRKVEIAASGTIVAFNGLGLGHVFVRFKTNEVVDNTISLWPDYDTNCDNGNPGWSITNQFYRSNNMCDFDGVKIDWEGSEGADLKYSLNPGVEGYRVLSRNIPKRFSDIYRFGGGYRWGARNWGKGNMDYSYTAGPDKSSISRNSGNCASFSQYLWNDIMADTEQWNSRVLPDIIVGGVTILNNKTGVPGDIRKAINYL